MSKGFIIAFLTAITSLVVAIYSIFKDKINFALSQRKRKKALSDQFLIKYIDALDIIICDIQRLKDVIQLIVRAEGTSMDSETAIKGVFDARKHIFESYEEQLTHLKEESRKVAHSAKNYSLEIELHIKKSLEEKKHVSEMHKKNREELLEFRNYLTDAQNLLRDIKATNLITLIAEK